MQIPILNGAYTSDSPDFRTSYPVNLVPVPVSQGISQGYLRPADGLVEFCTTSGIDRGGIEWNGECYRVVGSRLVKITSTGALIDLGYVGPGGQVTFDYSFDRLAIAAGGKMYYLQGTTLTQVTDTDLGAVVDLVWVDGYFMTTDGEFLVVTELNDPFEVNPLKFGSSEVDPDPVVALVKIRNEIYAVNRNSVEVFDNVGGNGFPFARVDGARLTKGAVGTHAACAFNDTLAFLGNGRNESPSIYLGSNASCVKIATREIDLILQTYTEAQLANVLVESRVDRGHLHLYVHLPDRTMVYDLAASQATNQPVWFFLTSALTGVSQYRGRNFVRCYDKWLCGDTQGNRIGYVDESISSHFGQNVRWEFGTLVVYGEGRGGIFHELELVTLTGSVELGKNPTISTSYSVDGQTWSNPMFISVGAIGQRSKRLRWMQLGHMLNWRIQRFQGDSQAHLSFARLEARIEPLAY